MSVVILEVLFKGILSRSMGNHMNALHCISEEICNEIM